MQRGTASRASRHSSRLRCGRGRGRSKTRLTSTGATAVHDRNKSSLGLIYPATKTAIIIVNHGRRFCHTNGDGTTGHGSRISTRYFRWVLTMHAGTCYFAMLMWDDVLRVFLYMEIGTSRDVRVPRYFLSAYRSSGTPPARCSASRLLRDPHVLRAHTPILACCR